MVFIGNSSHQRCRGSALPRALIISVVLHTLIFGATASLVLPVTPPPAGALQAVLGETRNTEPKAPSKPSLAARPQELAPVASAPAFPLHHNAAPVIAVAQGGGASVPVRGEAVVPAEAGAVDSSRGERMANTEHTSGERSGTPAPAREGMSADALRQYRLALGGEARRYKRYPRLARERGWQGVVEVMVRLGAAGPGASLGRSSGFAALDDQAVDMIALAVRQTPIPEALQGRELSFVLPVQFSLDE